MYFYTCQISYYSCRYTGGKSDSTSCNDEGIFGGAQGRSNVRETSIGERTGSTIGKEREEISKRYLLM